MLPVKVSKSNKATTHCSAEQKYLTNFFCNSENPQNMIKSIKRLWKPWRKRSGSEKAKEPQYLQRRRLEKRGWAKSLSQHKRKEKGKKMWKSASLNHQMWAFFDCGSIFQWLISSSRLSYSSAGDGLGWNSAPFLCCPCWLWSISQHFQVFARVCFEVFPNGLFSLYSTGCLWSTLSDA